MTTDLKAAPHSSLLLPVPYLINIETTHLKALRNHRWAISPSQRPEYAIT